MTGQYPLEDLGYRPGDARLQRNARTADGLSGLGDALDANAERWNVIETIADEATWQNGNGKF